jgi:hypothetical protein
MYICARTCAECWHCAVRKPMKLCIKGQLLGGYFAEGAQESHRGMAPIAKGCAVREVGAAARRHPRQQLYGDPCAVLSCEQLLTVKAAGCSTNRKGEGFRA